MKDSRGDRLGALLLLPAFILFSIDPVAPPWWRGSIALGAAVCALAIALTGRRSDLVLALFCAVMLLSRRVNPWHFWPMPLLAPLVVFGVLVLAMQPFRGAFPRVRWGGFDRRTLGLMAFTVVGSSIALMLWLSWMNPDVEDLRRQIPPWPAWTLPLAALGFAILNAVMEEYIWRGILWTLLQRVTSAAGVIVTLQAVSFGLMHIHGFPRGWVGVGMATLYGVFLGWIRHRSRGLGAPIATHVLADLTIFALLVTTASATASRAPVGVGNRVGDARGLEALAAQQATVARAAGEPLRRRIVATVGQRVVHAEPQSLANDLGLRQGDEGGVNLEVRSLDAGFGRERRESLEGLNELRPAIRIPGVIHRIHSDEDVPGSDGLRVGERKGEEDGVPRRDVGYGDGSADVRHARGLGNVKVIGERRTPERPEIDRLKHLPRHPHGGRDASGGLRLDFVALAVTEGECVDCEPPLAHERRKRGRV